MATVVITFFLFARFYVCKMDADSTERRRERYTSRRDRWSMNSQRLEQIVAELMKPISDIRRSFDTDLSALLEEYLTEAGLHALEAGEREDNEEEGLPANGVPNFAELALVLQHSACVYGRKVDFLYQHVLSVSDSLQHSTQDDAPPDQLSHDDSHVAKRRRRASAASGDFVLIDLEPCPGASREPDARVPPTLARHYVELEPRPTALWERPLVDYRGEPIGLPADFYVTWRLQNGLLVDELVSPSGPRTEPLRPISLAELQAAILAHGLPSPVRTSTPLMLEAPPLEPPPITPVVAKNERKRRNEVHLEDIAEGSLRLVISNELGARLAEVEEFSVRGGWVSRVIRRRKLRLLHQRHKSRKEEEDFTVFRGFDMAEEDVGGFLGWSRPPAAALPATPALPPPRTAEDSDDDGFFEQSSLGDSDSSRLDEEQRHAEGGWRGALDVRGVAARVLAACGPRALPADALLGRAAPRPRDVSTVLLATLFLANAGNVEIIQGPPLSVNSFSVRLLSTDHTLYTAATQLDLDKISR
ncbi:uncharacterized protein LOC114252897 isoform X1 [Bombyx mandarina]|uniref:Uncharacterized protein LOC114252897 isoform X1 n=1 Tax=Bombyx mandarina TaxID=7092 RepID=A0A6J2KMK5_BOMMA|nr:uncharacterized protein LOC114252897 isoform X1 [Bombyx mandarina]